MMRPGDHLNLGWARLILEDRVPGEVHPQVSAGTVGQLVVAGFGHILR